MKKLVMLTLSISIFLTSCVSYNPKGDLTSRLPSSMDIMEEDTHGSGIHFIKVIESKDKQSVGFSLCLIRDPNECTKIGPRSFYLKKDIVSLRHDLEIGRLVMSGSSGGMAIVTAGLTVLAIFGSVPTLGTSAVAATGAIATSAATSVFYGYRALDMHQKIKAVSNDVLNDKPVVLSYNILEVAKGLDELLADLK